MDTPNQQPLSKKQQRRLEKQAAKQARHASGNTSRTGKRVIVWLIILAVIGFFVYAIGKLATSTPGTDGEQTDIAIAATDWTKGSPEAEVELIEYADLQCPGCAAFQPIIKELMTEYSDRVYYAYRHFPLPQHPHAKAMAYAAEAAGAQDKFFEMHDLIFENQRSWTTSMSVQTVIENYANRLNLDMDRFETDMESAATRERVESQRSAGARYGANSTPTFFLNGAKIALPRSLEEFKSVIDQAILDANATAAPTTSSTAPATN